MLKSLALLSKDYSNTLQLRKTNRHPRRPPRNNQLTNLLSLRSPKTRIGTSVARSRRSSSRQNNPLQHSRSKRLRMDQVQGVLHRLVAVIIAETTTITKEMAEERKVHSSRLPSNNLMAAPNIISKKATLRKTIKMWLMSFHQRLKVVLLKKYRQWHPSSSILSSIRHP